MKKQEFVGGAPAVLKDAREVLGGGGGGAGAPTTAPTTPVAGMQQSLGAPNSEKKKSDTTFTAGR